MSDKSESLNMQALAMFQCPVCLETCFPPIYLCKNGHIVCKQCQPKLTACGTCREPGPPLERNFQLERIAELLKVSCNGCKLTFCIKDIEKHQATCDHRFKCRVCGECIGTAQDVKEHVHKEHPLSYFELSTNNIKVLPLSFAQVIHPHHDRLNFLFTFDGKVFWACIQYWSEASLFSHTVSVLSHDSSIAGKYQFRSELVSQDKNIKYRTLHEARVLRAGDWNREMEVFLNARIVRVCQKGLVCAILTMSLIGEDVKEEPKSQEGGPARPRRACRNRTKPY